MVLGKDGLVVGKSLLGIAGTALGLAVLLGSMSPVAGGGFGDATGGALARRLAEPVGVFFGVVCVLAPIWFAWLRGMISENSGQEGPAAAALSDQEAGGVSSEEAALLVPSEKSLEYLEDAWREVREADRPPTLVPSPYPEDPRLTGEVPDGAAPIESTDDQESRNRPTTARASRWNRTKSEVGAEVSAGEDLASQEHAAPEESAVADAVEAVQARTELSPEAATAPEPELAQGSVQESTQELGDPVDAIEERLKALQSVPAVEPLPEIEPVKPRARRAPQGSPSEAQTEPAAAEAALVAPLQEPPVAPAVTSQPVAPDPVVSDPVVTPLPKAVPIESTGHASGPPTPSWEQSDMFQAEEATEELGEAPAAEEEADGAVAEPAEQAAGEDSDADSEGEDDQEEVVAQAEDELEDEGDLDEAEDDEAVEAEEEEGEEEYEDEEYEDEEEEEEDDEEEEYEEGLEDDEEYEEEGDEEEEEYEEDEYEEEEEDEGEEEEYEEELEEEEGDEEEEEAEEEEDAVEEPQDELPEEPAGESDAEPEVVLQPQAAPDDAKIPTQPAVAASNLDSQLVYNAGVHFLEEGRVAVSMLQRKFGLDFDQACELLDQLQERGLIGPYLGGKRRDILMTLEQWEETVTSS